jgi:hydroxyacylglutathione hydrolase
MKKPDGESLHTISAVPVLADNYAWLLHDGKTAGVIDPGEAGPVLQAIAKSGLTLSSVLLTHHHADHCAGTPHLKRSCGCTVIGPKGTGIPEIDDAVEDGDQRMVVGEAMEVMAVPGHTRTHVAYFFPGLRALFTGDTLFGAGCGRVFESGAQQLFSSLSKLASLDDSTFIYCGHEYTEENLLFAAKVEPENKAVWRRLAEVNSLRSRGIATMPSTLGIERETNPFLRTGAPLLRKYLGMEKAPALDVFIELRKRKDQF